MALVSTDKPSIDEQRYARLLKHNRVLSRPDILEIVLEIKRALQLGDEHYALQLWGELSMDHDENQRLQRALYVAPKYGGIFTTKEREIIK